MEQQGILQSEGFLPWKGDRIAELENKIATFFDTQAYSHMIGKYIMFIEKDEN